MHAKRLDHYCMNFDGTKTERTPEGFLKVYGAIATRVGIFDYKTHKEFRSPEEVFKQKHIDSCIGKPITKNGHPKEFINSQNATKHAVGTVLNAYKVDDNNLGVDLCIQDEDAIKKIENGKCAELSFGYGVVLEKQDGEWNGEKYDYVQKEMVVNHLSLVATARAGTITRINLDDANSDFADSVENNSDAQDNQDETINSTPMDKDPKKPAGGENAAVATLNVTIESLQTTIQSLREAGYVKDEKINKLESDLRKSNDLLASTIAKHKIVSQAKDAGINTDALLKDEKFDEMSTTDVYKKLITQKEPSLASRLDDMDENGLKGVLVGMGFAKENKMDGMAKKLSSVTQHLDSGGASFEDTFLANQSN